VSDTPVDVAKAEPQEMKALVRRPVAELLEPIDPADMRNVWQAVVRAATTESNMKAAEVAGRWWRHRQRVLRLDLPPVDAAAGVAKAYLVALVAAGEITPREGRDVSTLVENRRKAIFAQDLEQKLYELERMPLPWG
jgi:hypothetical protein